MEMHDHCRNDNDEKLYESMYTRLLWDRDAYDDALRSALKHAINTESFIHDCIVTAQENAGRHMTPTDVICRTLVNQMEMAGYVNCDRFISE